MSKNKYLVISEVDKLHAPGVFVTVYKGSDEPTADRIHAREVRKHRVCYMITHGTQTSKS